MAPLGHFRRQHRPPHTSAAMERREGDGRGTAGAAVDPVTEMPLSDEGAGVSTAGDAGQRDGSCLGGTEQGGQFIVLLRTV